MRLFSIVAIVIIFGFLFVGILHLHPVGEALGNSEVLQERPKQVLISMVLAPWMITFYAMVRLKQSQITL